MPTYDYHCEACEYQTEVVQKMTDAPLCTCPQCQKDTLRRGPGGGVGLIFKGSGFYITDYARKPKEPEKPKGPKEPASAASSSTTSTSESE